MTWASRQRRPVRGAVADPVEDLGIVVIARRTWAWPGRASHGYFRVASRVARVRFRPVPGTLASSLVSSRRLCALPSKPPQPAATAASAYSPLWPNGGCPRSCARQAASTRSGSQPSAAPSSRPICAHSSECVSLVRGKSLSRPRPPASWPPACAARSCAAPGRGPAGTGRATGAGYACAAPAPSLRRVAVVAGGHRLRSPGSPGVAASGGLLDRARPASSRATGTRNGEQDT